jgi:UDP-N-acetylglucosamine acyltransferase
MSSIHPTALITGDVQLGSGNTIGAFAVITGPVVLGDDNWIGAGAVIGAPPEVRSFEHPRGDAKDGSSPGVRIGDRNVIREYVQIHQGWKQQTVIENDAFVMNQAYVAHDCHLEDGVTLASSVLLAGHVHVGSRANLGLGTTVHQFRIVGRGAMVGMAAAVTRDIPPFAKAFGNPAVVRDANVVGMERMGLEPELIATLTAVYRGESTDASSITGDDTRTAVETWLGVRADRGARR